MRRARLPLAALAATTLAAALTAAAPPAQPATPIRHVVVIYLENHSFDNVLGYWCDQNPGRCPDGGMPASVTLSDGTVITPGGDPDTVPNIDHGGTAQVIAMDGGAMDGWANIPPGNEGGCDASYNYQCITGYQPSQIPNITGLASAFAISDRFFSLSDSPSWEGHLYAVAASAGGFWGDTPFAVPETASHPGWGCDSGKEARWAPPGGAYERVPSCIPEPALARLRSRSGGAFEATPVPQVPSIMDRLDAAGLPWRIYGAARPGQAGYGKFDICPSFAACLDTAQKGNLVPDSQFLTNAASGTLPAFSVVTPGGPGLRQLVPQHRVDDRV